jgi:hypothetical protein
MGNGPFMCYNLPHQFQIGWQTPPVLSAGALPIGGVVTRTITAPSRTGGTAGLMVNTKSWDGRLDNVFINFLLAEGGYSQMNQASFHAKTAVYRWNGTNFFSRQPIPAYVTSLVSTGIANMPVRAALRHI